LEDVWAQIVERLADRWGRGIRYGNPPDEPDASIRVGEQVISRRQAISLLTELSDSIEAFELNRAVLDVEAQVFPMFGRLMTYMRQFKEAQDHRPVSELPANQRAAAETPVGEDRLCRDHSHAALPC
jgi:hypothetical protein